MQIQKLLNPSQGGRHEPRGHSTTRAPHNYPTTLATPTIPARQKMVKDAPVFSDGNKLVGHVNYWPHEADGDRALASQHRRFHVYPLGQICNKGVRHIPYNSDRKTFSDTTGRSAFEMFQYTYRVPGEDKEYVVVWDYNIGLVRMTPFFKACKYSKTTPAKALRDNPGMKEISYSITGGALVCQGYWMPYQAARAIAATFCHKIRFALTPVFGNDFPATCLDPDHPNFGKFNIDSDIVKFCEAETRRFREQGSSYRVDCPMTSSSVSSSQQEELETGPTCQESIQSPSIASYTEADRMRWFELGLRATRTPSPEPKHDKHTLRWLKGGFEAGEDACEYSSDTDSNGKGIFSAHVSPRTQTSWVSINGSVMNSPTPRGVKYPDSPFTSRMTNPFSPTSAPAEFAVPSPRPLQSHLRVAGSEYGEPMVSPRTRRGHPVVVEDDDDTIMLDRGTNPSEADIEAAHALVSLSRGG